MATTSIAISTFHSNLLMIYGDYRYAHRHLDRKDNNKKALAELIIQHAIIDDAARDETLQAHLLSYFPELAGPIAEAVMELGRSTAPEESTAQTTERTST